MNKKFSTLVASLLLATTVGTGYAQAQIGTISAAPSGEYVAAIENGKFYQLSNGRQVLIMDRTSKGTYVLKFVDYNNAELAKSLWEIKAVKNNNENGIAFQFVNLTTGLPISFDPNSVNDLKVSQGMWSVTELSQGTNHWSWLRGTEGAALLGSKSVEAYFGAKNDSIVTLVNTRNGVAAVKYATKDVTSIPNHLKFTVKKANPVYLNAYDLNTMLQSRDPEKGLSLTFNNEPEGAEFANEFTARDYKVVDPVGKNSLSLGTKADKLVEIEDAKEWLEIATDNYISKLEELESANASLQGVFGELIKLENKVKGLTAKQGKKQVEENAAKTAYEEAYEAKALIEQSIKDLPADEDLQKQLAEAAEALGKAKEKKDAWKKQQADLTQKADAAFDKWREAWNAFASAGPDKKDELHAVEQSALDVY